MLKWPLEMALISDGLATKMEAALFAIQEIGTECVRTCAGSEAGGAGLGG